MLLVSFRFHLHEIPVVTYFGFTYMGYSSHWCFWFHSFCIWFPFWLHLHWLFQSLALLLSLSVSLTLGIPVVGAWFPLEVRDGHKRRDEVVDGPRDDDIVVDAHQTGDDQLSYSNTWFKQHGIDYTSLTVIFIFNRINKACFPIPYHSMTSCFS